mmetsp:Transcript_6888/g.12306  ORF Transcript_6888/g.12306 Transcript_6888/m.12306 type:complete len:219 (-) Transcript_6888:2177-2833(-)
MTPTTNQSRHLHRTQPPTINLIHTQQQIPHIHLSIQNTRLLDRMHHRHIPRLIIHHNPQLARRRNHSHPFPTGSLLVPIGSTIRILVRGIVPEYIGIGGIVPTSVRRCHSAGNAVRVEAFASHAEFVHASFGGDHAFADGVVGVGFGVGVGALAEVGVAEGGDVVFSFAGFDGAKVVLSGGCVCGWWRLPLWRRRRLVECWGWRGLWCFFWWESLGWW